MPSLVNSLQVPLDPAGSHEDRAADLRVRQAVSGEPADLLLLRSEHLVLLGLRFRTVPLVATSLPRSFPERIHADRVDGVPQWVDPWTPQGVHRRDGSPQPRQ